ncbi:MAG: hypothetical protein JWP81_995 [Ferruginibacter sp.]|nr:hypothetical protein [Ferruginibacter sp.]
MPRKIATISFIIIAVFICITAIQYCSPKKNEMADMSPETNSYVGDRQCKSCHANEYRDWQQSDHFKAIQKADDSSVLGNFNDITFNADGISSHFFKKNGKFIVNTEGDDGKKHDYEIKYAFGFFPLQQYLVEFPGGKLQTTRLSWDSRQKKWFHQYAGQKIDHRDWLHWTGNAQNWNTMCSECHSTNLKKNYDIEKDVYNTGFDVLNVSCESCHGAGKNHITYINGAEYKKGNKIEHSLLQLGTNPKQLAEINSCAGCHSLRSAVDAHNINSNELLDDYIPVIPNTAHFYADGQVNDEDYTYASFLQSKMYSRNVTCSNCHNPHSGKLKLAGNQTCLQCHNKSYDAPSHHFHTSNTVGAECKNCHAPGKYYMGNDYRYDHSFRVPRPDLSVKYATPNACNNCHTTQSAKWAADAIVKWYGPKRKYHFAEDLIPGSQLINQSEGHLKKLIGDTAVPDIIKATAVNYLGSISTESSLNTLLFCLKEKNAQIRYEALRSLLNFSSDISDKIVIADLLTDKVRSVRIAAAELIGNIGTDGLPAQYLAAYQQAKGELEKHLLNQADFAHGNIAIADYYQLNKSFAAAEKFYTRALKKDSLANIARLNLAITYSIQGKNTAALNILKEAIHTDPKNDEAWHKMAILYNELKDTANALMAFEKAAQLKSQNNRLYYNYGLLLQQIGNSNRAISILKRGLLLYPSDEGLNYAMAFVYIQNKQPSLARPFATVLKQINPGNPDYLQLFTLLGMN